MDDTPNFFDEPPYPNGKRLRSPVTDQQYQLCALLGSGGFGEVYYGFGMEDEFPHYGPVAIKIMSDQWSVSV